LSAECLFVDPIADIAVLGCPDGQTEYPDEAEAYDELIDDAPVVSIAKPRSGKGWLCRLVCSDISGFTGETPLAARFPLTAVITDAAGCVTEIRIEPDEAVQ